MPTLNAALSAARESVAACRRIVRERTERNLASALSRLDAAYARARASLEADAREAEAEAARLSEEADAAIAARVEAGDAQLRAVAAEAASSLSYIEAAGAVDREDFLSEHLGEGPVRPTEEDVRAGIALAEAEDALGAEAAVAAVAFPTAETITATAANAPAGAEASAPPSLREAPEALAGIDRGEVKAAARAEKKATAPRGGKGRKR